MENQFTAKQVEKAKACKNTEEILKLAKETGMELTEAEAKNMFAKLNPTNGELSDSELESVSGGCGGDECSAGDKHDWQPTGEKNGESTKMRCSKCGETKWHGEHHSPGLR